MADGTKEKQAKAKKPKLRRPGWIVQRGENTWLARIFVNRDESGKRHYESRTVHGTKQDAEDALADLYSDKRKGKLGARSLTVSSLLDLVVQDYTINGQNVDWVKIVIERLRENLDCEKAVSKLKPLHVEAYKARRVKKAANATVNHELAILRRSFTLGVKHGLLAIAPFRIESLKLDNVRRGFFEHTEYTRLRDCLPSELKPVLAMGYYTGMRKGEILGLKWQQADLVRRIIRLEPGETKNKEGRIIPLHVEELYQMLTIQRSIRDQLFPDSPWVFSRAGQPILHFRKSWDTACKLAGFWDAERKRPTKLFHDLRRTGVRNLLRAGVPEKITMQISGHKTRSTFERYNIVDERDVIQAMQKLDAYTRERVAQEKEAADSKEQKGSVAPKPS